VAIKESSGVMSQITELLGHAPAGFAIFAGDDALALPVIALGGVGVISVASNAVPGPLAKMVASALANDWPTARSINTQHFALIQALFSEPSPGPIKAVLALLGLCAETLRLPMVPVTGPTRDKLRDLLLHLKLLQP
jgi:4-hydroxy-tetrahydrodipicolinate synthase